MNLLDTTYELSEKGIKIYGGNYSFYKEQKEIEERALAQQINSEKASLRLARKKAQEVRERQDKRTSQGGRNKQKGGTPRILMNARAGLAENSTAKLEQKHEIRLRLNRALFPQETWNKNCQTLSGGERMRLYLYCLMISNHIPDMFILDEPTNNLDISSLSILTNTVKNYKGTVLVISHDKHFIDEIGITKSIELKIRNESI